MKVLVIDDSPRHQTSAIQTLAGHDVTVCFSHEEAEKFLYPKYDMEKLESLWKTTRPGSEKYELAKKQYALPYWDVVLSDLLMPAGSMAQAGEGLKYVGQEMPVGWSLAFYAAKAGAKYIAVVTDMNHHNHPASAMLDVLNGHIFSIDGAKMLLTNRAHVVGITGTECTCTTCGGTGKQHNPSYPCCFCKDGVDFSEKGKDWGKVLKQLTGDLPFK